MNNIQIEKLLSKMPDIISWIDATLTAHADLARPAASFGFKRLLDFYSPQFLEAAKVVVVERVPVPPLEALGLPELADFERGQYVGMTFKDTYFVVAAEASRESLHFHELVHVVQWAHLGVERFLSAYAAGLAIEGYRNSPLEVMAYELEAHFENGGNPIDIVATVRRQLNNVTL
ncbi:MAG: hypothetical protein ACK5TH_23725 [Prosthecobacter sp.]|jgi:hypothetical protein